MIKTKSVKSPIERNDGLRNLVARHLVRYLRRTSYDVWMPNLGPSEILLGEFRRGKIGWGEFSIRYRQELTENGSIDRRNTRVKNHGQKFTLRLLQQLGQQGDVTLLCHCEEDEPECHRHLLKKKLDGKI